MFSFTLQKTKENARAGVMFTARGEVQTPVFMPVGTQATVKSLSPDDVERTGAQIILANTYHLHLRPGEERLKKLGGVHSFMRWNKPMLTDSGGFQVFSLGEQMAVKEGVAAQLSKVTEEGVEFTSHLDGSKHFFTPEKAMYIQRCIGADIVMAFDQCTSDTAPEVDARAAMQRTHRWVERCVNDWQKSERLSEQKMYQALFGIAQGGMHESLRKESVQFIAQLPVDGVALGGETVGYNMDGTEEMMSWVRADLPQHKPRYAMGLGREPQDIIRAVRSGIDMFDCVAPTRLARNGALYSGQLQGDAPASWQFVSEFPKSRVQIGNAQFAEDLGPVDENCKCWTCTQGYSRAYLHHLYKTQELLYYRLASIHNVTMMVQLAQQLRNQILVEG